MSQKQFAEHMQDVLAVELAPDMDGQALPRELVDDGQHPERLAVMGAIHDEVIGPNVVPVCRSQPDARTVIKPEPASLRLLLWNLEPLTSPDALDPFQANRPAILLKQPVDAPVSISPKPGSQINDRPCQNIFISPAAWRLALRRSMLSEHRTGTALGHIQFPYNMIDAAATAWRA